MLAIILVLQDTASDPDQNFRELTLAQQHPKMYPLDFEQILGPLHKPERVA